MFAELPDILSATDAGKALGVSNKTVYQLINSGKVKHFRMGSVIKVPKCYLVEYIKAECYNDPATGNLPCHPEGSAIQ